MRRTLSTNLGAKGRRRRNRADQERGAPGRVALNSDATRECKRGTELRGRMCETYRTGGTKRGTAGGRTTRRKEQGARRERKHAADISARSSSEGGSTVRGRPRPASHCGPSSPSSSMRTPNISFPNQFLSPLTLAYSPSVNTFKRLQLRNVANYSLSTRPPAKTSSQG